MALLCESVRVIILERFEVVWQPSQMWQFLLSSVALLSGEKRQGANLSNTAALWKEAGKAKSFCVPSCTHAHSALFFSCRDCFFFSVHHHAFLQPSTIYIAKADTIKWSRTWQALKEFCVCKWLPVIICSSISFFLQIIMKNTRLETKLCFLDLEIIILTRKLEGRWWISQCENWVMMKSETEGSKWYYPGQVVVV